MRDILKLTPNVYDSACFMSGTVCGVVLCPRYHRQWYCVFDEEWRFAGSIRQALRRADHIKRRCPHCSA